MIGDSLTSAILQKALDGTWQRERAIANNIANQETPGYKAIKVSFEESLDQEVRRLKNGAGSTEEITRSIASIKNSDIMAYQDNMSSGRADGNNVDIESENIDIAKTQIQYQYLTRSMTDMFSRLRYAISEGKR